MKVWPYIAQCTQTGTLFLGIMESLDRKGVIGALQRLSYSVGIVPHTVVTDASHSFTNRTWNPECVDGEKLWKNTTFKRCLSRAQRRNSCESRVHSVKSLLEKLLRYNREEEINKLSHLTLLELFTALQLCSHYMNDSPIDSSSSLTPNQILHGSKYCLLNTPRHEESKCNDAASDLEKRLKDFEAECEKELLKTLTADESRFREKFHKDGTKFSSLNLQPEAGDICIIKQKGLRETPMYARVIEKKSDQTLLVKTKKGKKEVQAAVVHPIFAMRWGLKRYDYNLINKCFSSGAPSNFKNHTKNANIKNKKGTIIGWNFTNKMKFLEIDTTFDHSFADIQFFSCVKSCFIISYVTESKRLRGKDLIEEDSYKADTNVTTVSLCPDRHMLATTLTAILNNPNMSISATLTIVSLSILTIMSALTEAAGLSVSGTWWNDPTSWSDAVDGQGYVKRELVPLIIKLNEGLLRKITQNHQIAESNQSFLTVTIILLGVLASLYLGYWLTQVKNQKRKLKEKESRDAQVDQLLEWRRMELIRRQNQHNVNMPALPVAQLNVQNERNLA